MCLSGVFGSKRSYTYAPIRIELDEKFKGLKTLKNVAAHVVKFVLLIFANLLTLGQSKYCRGKLQNYFSELLHQERSPVHTKLSAMQSQITVIYLGTRTREYQDGYVISDTFKGAWQL